VKVVTNFNGQNILEKDVGILDEKRTGIQKRLFISFKRPRWVKPFGS